MEKKRILNLLLISFLFMMAVYLVYAGTAGITPSTAGSSVNASGGVTRANLHANDSEWTQGGAAELINFTVNFSGDGAVSAFNITVPTTGYTVENLHAMNASGRQSNDFNWTFANRSASTVSGFSGNQNYSNSLKVPLNIWFNTTAVNNTEGVFAWTVNLSDNQTATGTNATTFYTYVDGMSPRVSEVNITDGTNTLIASSGGLNETKYLKQGVNWTVYATVNDTNFRANSSVILYYNISGVVTQGSLGDTYQRVIMNVTGTQSPYLVSGILVTGSSNNFTDGNTTRFMLVANDSFNQVYATNSFNFTVDGDSPVVTVTPPSSTSIDTSASITYKCSATDRSAVTYEWTIVKPNDKTITKTTQDITLTGADTEGAGTYDVTCKATDEVGQSTTSTVYQFTAHLKSTGGTGGSGGSGATTSTGEEGEKVVELKVDHVITEVGAVVEISKKQGQSVSITLDNKVAHTIKFRTVTSGSATIVIESEPVEVTLNVGETKQVDTDGDGSNDLEVTLESISGGNAKVTVKKIAQTAAELAVPEPTTEAVRETPPATTTPTTPSGPEKGASLAWLWVLIVIIVIVAVVLAVKQKKKK